MSVGPDELTELIEASWLGAAEREATRATTVIDTIQKTNISADLASDNSKYLRQVVEAHREILKPDAYERLTRTDMFGVPVNFIDATVRRKEGRDQIFMFEGMQQLIFFYASLIRVMDLLGVEQPDYTVTVGGEDHPAVVLAGMAGFAILADGMATGREFGAISDLVDPAAFRNTGLGYQGAVMFILLHELGHIERGHLGSGIGRSEVHEMELAFPEEIRSRQLKEFEADAFAIEAIREDMRAVWMSNVLFFLGPFAFIETFMHPKAAAHPLSANRISRLVKAAGLTGEDARIPLEIVDSLKGMLQRQLVDRSLDEDRRGRIAETMPVEVAYKVFDTIRHDLVASNQLLGQFPE